MPAAGPAPRRRPAPPPPGPALDPGVLAQAAAVLSPARLADPLGRGEAAALEAALARRLGGAGAVAVASGSLALDLALAVALEGQTEAEVVVPLDLPAYLAERVVRAGGRMRPAPLDLQRGTLSPEGAAAAVSPRTRALLAVDQDGVPCALEDLMAVAGRAGALLIEDAAPALGGREGSRRAGAGAHLTVLSFGWGKPVCAGEGGAVVAGSVPLWRAARRHRLPGPGGERPAGVLGAARLHPVAARLARGGLSRAEALAARRRLRIRRLERILGPVLPPGLSFWRTPRGVHPSGCGGLRLRLEAGPGAEALLDRLQRGAEAWHLDLTVRRLTAPPAAPQWGLSLPFWDLAAASEGQLGWLEEALTGWLVEAGP